MRIKIEVTHTELREMNVSRDRLRAALYDQLDDAKLTSGKRAVELVGYDIEIEITSE